MAATFSLGCPYSLCRKCLFPNETFTGDWAIASTLPWDLYSHSLRTLTEGEDWVQAELWRLFLNCVTIQLLNFSNPWAGCFLCDLNGRKAETHGRSMASSLTLKAPPALMRWDVEVLRGECDEEENRWETWGGGLLYGLWRGAHFTGLNVPASTWMNILIAKHILANVFQDKP